MYCTILCSSTHASNSTMVEYEGIMCYSTSCENFQSYRSVSECYIVSIMVTKFRYSKILSIKGKKIKYNFVSIWIKHNVRFRSIMYLYMPTHMKHISKRWVTAYCYVNYQLNTQHKSSFAFWNIPLHTLALTTTYYKSVWKFIL